ncbi:MAG: HAMP domain-containing histidine kinase, partial [Acidobacteriota bacterium]|nr:HAMP domain-containing histidine kinase [Acidobacteriota bacterium]
DRMRASLQAGLERVSRDFQSEINTACRAIAPEDPKPEPAELAAQVTARYAAWKAAGQAVQLIRGVGVVTREGDRLVLRLPDADGKFLPAAWPAEWKGTQHFLEGVILREDRGGRGAGPPLEESTTFEVPVFIMPGPPGFGPGPGRGGFGDRGGPRRGTAWMVFDLNRKYVMESALPDLLQRHLGAAARQEYLFAVTLHDAPSQTLYTSDPAPASSVAANADAEADLLAISPDMLRPRGRGGRGFGPDGFRMAGSGRWELWVRHRAGSLETVVERTRQRNLAVTGGVLLLILASAAALIRFSRRAQRLAELQMNFVAGVSHELRTPLTVINTAAYNLQSSVNRSPEQVAKYGALIRQESGRLKEMVEQVLTFAGSQAGSITREVQPLAVEDIIEASLESSRTVIESAHFAVEKEIAPDLPLIAGDARALQHAIQNLLTNAVKYGKGERNWIGIRAALDPDGSQPRIEIRVADRGPGIPAEEQRQIFDPFYRGKRAVQDQIHGTGLGLTLVKEIVSAHRGTIAVHSQPEKGTEFVLRLPVAPKEFQDEFANSASRG